MTSSLQRFSHAFRTFLSAFLCLGALAGCGAAGAPPPYLTTLARGCPDGSDLLVRFADVDGTIEADASCAAPDPMRTERWPERESIPSADRLRRQLPDQEPPGRWTEVERMRAEESPGGPREGGPSMDR
jgi:hypothetical protein